jgi:hypothetical protein
MFASARTEPSGYVDIETAFKGLVVDRKSFEVALMFSSAVGRKFED